MTAASRPDDCLLGGGEMGALMRDTDWASTPLGAVTRWPQSLRTTVSTCLSSRFPILIWWDPELVMLYNDAYRPVLGSSKHPTAMGQRGRECWPDVWHIIGPMLEGVLRTGEATWSEDQMLPLQRHGFVEECFFTFSYSPVRDASGGVGCVFTCVTETTARVVGERRLERLRALGERAVGAPGVDEACHAAMEALQRNAADLPACAIHLVDKAGRRRTMADALDARIGAAVEMAAGTGAVQVLRDVDVDADALIVGGPWPEPVRTVVVAPIPAQVGGEQEGVLVVAISPRRALDDPYLRFLALVAGSLGTAISNARAFEKERERAAALAALDRAKTTFFSNVSHELRTPLTLMLGPVEELLAMGPADELPRIFERFHRVEGVRARSVEGSGIGLPVVDGFELALRFRDDEKLREVALISRSGYGQPRDFERSRAVGFREHLVKPIDVEARRRSIQGARQFTATSSV
jgi:hypothetical protein